MYAATMSLETTYVKLTKFLCTNSQGIQIIGDSVKYQSGNGISIRNRKVQNMAPWSMDPLCGPAIFTTPKITEVNNNKNKVLNKISKLKKVNSQ